MTGGRNRDEEALALHRAYRGKVQMMAKVPMRSLEDLAVWYTPGVAAPSRAIADDPALVWDYTNKGNTIAIVSDGSRVLGLGDIGPLAGLPVMEGKALLFKHFGGVDAVPLCVGTHDQEGIVILVKALAPSFGGINLEDIATPRCFRVLERLRADLPIPVWHDDQQGTATVVLAGLTNALTVVGKNLDEIRIALIGIGAANMAVYRLLKSRGVDPVAIVACDSAGTLHAGRDDIARMQGLLPEKWAVCTETNPDRIAGSIPDALRGADVCLAFSQPGPGTIPPAAVAAMAKDAIIFACANPVPEIWPQEARDAGARIVATGRSDFDNQVNNSLVFPGLFRGVLDVGASAITDAMIVAAAEAISARGVKAGIGETSILPRTDDMEVAAAIAAAVGVEAQKEGIARLTVSGERLFAMAIDKISNARRALDQLTASGLVRPA
jgi:malate dehydrogenase (oxaloacetate-decarboxylating)